MSASTIRKALAALSGTLMLLLTGGALASSINMTPGVTEISNEIYGLHMLIFWIVTIVGIGVFGVMIYSIIAHRKSKGAVPAEFHENTKLEVIWTIIPFVILVLVAVPATKTLLKIEDASEPDLTIKATGYQWKWHYDYLDEGISFFSALDAASNEARQMNSGKDPNEVEHYLLNVDNPMVVPVGKKVRILTTAADVIHAWWVPALGVKRDAIPGFINENWTRIDEPGVYRGQCAELCGKDHGFMPIVVVAKEEAEYQQWVAQQKAAKEAEAAAAGKTYTMDELMKLGEEKYGAACASCHLPNGEGVPNVFPGLKGSAMVTGPVEAHLDIVINGSKTNPAMAAFGAQLSDSELAAIITYERNAWGNDTGDLVQPADIAAYKSKASR